MLEAWLCFSTASFTTVVLPPAKMPSWAGMVASTSAQHRQSGEARARGARPGEKSNVGQWMQELPLEKQMGFAGRGLCMLISSRQHIALLVTDGL